MSDLGLDVGESDVVGGWCANDEMPNEVAKNLKEKKVDVEFVKGGITL